jgi:hypothetical protein
MFKKFITVDHEKADEVRNWAPGRGTGMALGLMSQALLDGRVVFIHESDQPDKNHPSNSTMAARGFSVHQRKGDNGIYFWADPK